MDSFLAFLHQTKEKYNIEEQIHKEKVKEKEKCELLKKNFEYCLKLNKYILGDYYEDKICDNLKLIYFEKCK